VTKKIEKPAKPASTVQSVAYGHNTRDRSHAGQAARVREELLERREIREEDGVGERYDDSDADPGSR